MNETREDLPESRCARTEGKLADFVTGRLADA
jgi:hypothetical protein